MIAMICCCFAGLALATQSIPVSQAPSGMKMLDQDRAGMDVELNVGQVDFVPVTTPEGDFTLAKINYMGRSFNIGEPCLPVAGKIVEIPYGCELQAQVVNYDVQEYSLSDYGITAPLMPTQPSVSKSDDPADIPFEYNRTVYQTAGYYSLPMAQTEILGTLRDMRLARVAIAPVEYNPTENKLRVYNNITVRINFNNPDWNQTEAMRTKYYSPAFEPIYSLMLNGENFAGESRADSTDRTKYPIKYLIISDRMFEDQLQEFIDWKTKKGFVVVTAYTDVIGTSTSAIKSYISSVYNAGTPEDPAPSFVLFVGDVQQIPAWSGSAGSHITDLKYCELTGDNLPEIYYGRFSAQSTAQLQPIIDKTLEYEQYLMPDPSYLAEVTLVSGVDASYASTYGNGQLNYGTNYYFNAAHGITPHVWLYPASNQSGAAAAIIQSVSDGVSLYNYTAHCSHTGHYNPPFETDDLPGLTNYHQYLLGIGNCCESNTFGTDYGTDCFGEAFLKLQDKGGIGYIGGTNSTYWDEDYWWGVGYGPVVGSGPTYEQTTIGAYDGVFHDYGNPPVEKHYVANDAIIFAGDLAVSASGSSRTTYYWEIYTLMGDPSLMTYLGVPTENNVSHEATVLLTATSFTVQADPASYVGITFNGVLHGTGYIDESGSVDIDLVPFGTVGTMDIVVTAQNKIPYISTVQIISPNGPFVIHDSHDVNDVSGNDDGEINCGETIGLGVQLTNVGPDTAYNVTAVLSSPDPLVNITDNSESYGVIDPDFGIVDIADAFTFEVSDDLPNDHDIAFVLEVSDGDTTWTSNFSIMGHCYPACSFDPVTVYDSVFLGDMCYDTITVQNDGKATLEISFSSSNSWLTVGGGMQYVDPYGSLEVPISMNSASLAYGDFTAYVNYSTNDPSAASGSVPAYLHVFSPDISVSDMSVETMVAPDDQSSVPLTIYNNGPGPLEFEIARLMFDGKGVAKSSTPVEPLGYRPADPDKSMTGETEPYFAPATKGSGGPDLWGYSWVDSDDPEGPTYGWVDITTVGTAVALDDDSASLAIPIGFDFPFYENFYNELYIGSNGIITFGAGSKQRTNRAIPDAELPNNLIAVWWDDLDPSAAGMIYYYYDAANTRFIVSFVGIPNYYNPDGTGSLTFQAILYPNGVIVMQYNDMTPGSDGAGLAGSTIGIENALANDGLQVVYNAEYIHNEMAILFNAASWLSVEPGSGSIPPFSNAVVNVNFDAAELTPDVYNGQLSIYSDDPDTPQLDLPVTMTVATEAPPPAPALVSPDDGAEDVSQPLMIDWDVVGGADMYELQIDTSATFAERMMDTTMGATECEVSGMTEGMTYHWRVRAHNVFDWGDWSAIRTFSTELTWICGDIDNDSLINIFDITYIIQYLYLEGPAPMFPNAADVNNDGTINIFDATHMIEFLYRNGPDPVCPAK